MKIPKKVVEQVEATTVEIHAKIRDSGSYTLKGPQGEIIAERDDYVPSFFPGEHFGDYLILNVDIETGLIQNWKSPAPEDVAKSFGILEY